MAKSLSDPSPFCAPCRAHQFDITNLRADHRKIAEGLLANHAAAIAGMNEESARQSRAIAAARAERDQLVNTIATEYIEAPTDALQGMIHRGVNNDLYTRAEQAFNSRDRAMAAVWRIVERHHELPSGKCRCGAPIRSCRDSAAIEFFRGDYDRWERRQIELMNQDRHHGLPADHPQARGSDGYRWKGGRSTAPEVRRGHRV